VLWRYLLNIAIAADQLLNAILFGDPDETVSSRAAKNASRHGWRQVCRFLEWIDPGHLKRSLEPDEGDRALWK
jgi:hypothetical protein